MIDLSLQFTFLFQGRVRRGCGHVAIEIPIKIKSRIVKSSQLLLTICTPFTRILKYSYIYQEFGKVIAVLPVDYRPRRLFSYIVRGQEMLQCTSISADTDITERKRHYTLNNLPPYKILPKSLGGGKKKQVIFGTTFSFCRNRVKERFRLIANI